MQNTGRPSCHESGLIAHQIRKSAHSAPPLKKRLVKVVDMDQRLTPATALMLTLAPLLWAGNAVVGHAVQGLIAPMMLNFLRWLLAFVILAPLAWGVLRPGSAMWADWKRLSLLGLLGIGCYNALQYLALQTSTPLNVTLVASSLPVWMLGVGAVCFGKPVSRWQALGALLSIVGVLVVLSRGEWSLLLAVRLVPGDVYVLLATLAWAFYSWLLNQPKNLPQYTPTGSLLVSGDWAAFLLAQIFFGLVWSGLFAGGEWALLDTRINWGWPLAAALLYIAFGPAVVAYRCWGLGVQRAGPAIAGFFSNLTPLFAAVLSAAFLGEFPNFYHSLAFGLIVGGITISVRR